MPTPLTVPERRVADTDSFPVSPAGVASWLARLQPLESDADAHELVRGLTHSNRLHNDVDRRRSVIACFIPPLRALHERLADTARAQPLPLAAAFARAQTLCDALLREEALGFRLLLADADPPLADDARRAMLALVRRAELRINGYRRIPDELLRDAHAVHRFAIEHGLAPLLARAPDRNTPSSRSPSDAPDGASEGAIESLYRHLLALTLIDPRRHRARQLPLLLEWLRERAESIGLSQDVDACRRRAPGRLALDTRAGTAPAAAGSVLVDEPDDALAIDLSPLLDIVHDQLDDMQQARSSLLGADTLERQTLARLAVTLGEHRPRRHARRREDEPTELVFGHQGVCARLRYGAEPVAPGIGLGGWRIADRSPEGLRLTSATASVGSVQVGELTLVVAGDAAQPPTPSAPEASASTQRGLTLAVVRRVASDDAAALEIGIELLARAAMSVGIVREADPDSAPEQGLVIACRIGNTSVQSLLVPPFLFQAGDVLRLVQGPRSRRVELTRCLQLNGLFSHYALGDGG